LFYTQKKSVWLGIPSGKTGTLKHLILFSSNSVIVYVAFISD